MSKQRNPSSVTVATSQTTSTTYFTGDAVQGCFQLPAVFDGTSAQIEGAIDDVAANFTKVPVEGNEVNPLVVAANGTYAFPVKTFNFKYLRIVVAAQTTAGATIKVFSRDR